MMVRHMLVLVDKLPDNVSVGGGRWPRAFEFESF